RPGRVEERRGRRGAAAVVGDLENVESGQAPRHEQRVDLLLDVTGQQEAPSAGFPEQNDRDVVDAGAGVGRFERYLAPDWPQDPQLDVVDPQPIAGQQWRDVASEPDEPGLPRAVPGS